MTTEISIPIVTTSFEEQYIRLRRKEGRLLDDATVLRLPDLSKKHPHYAEWKIRTASMQLFLFYLKKKKYFLRILEIGCGNGWFSNQLAKLPNTNVTGIDVNREELAQAKRLFQKDNLQFLEVDIRKEFLESRFDIIVFAASFQYFDPRQEIFSILFQQLNTGGEVHIIDTHFYRASEAERAAQRTAAYFKSMQAEEMNPFYFHHRLEVLKRYDYKVLNGIRIMVNQVARRKTVFPWIRIKKITC